MRARPASVCEVGGSRGYVDDGADPPPPVVAYAGEYPLPPRSATPPVSRGRGPAAHQFAPPPRAWTKEYQEALHLPFNEPEDRLRRSNEIRRIANEFVDAAMAYGKTVIAEAFLPPTMHTIKSLDSAGVAGGAKYLVGGIFFKFATDLHNLYGGDEFAAKAAGHELLGITEISNCGVPGISVPLVALIDYCGFRLLASSELAVDHTTLKYGSADGGKTVHFSDEEIKQKMVTVARLLNLKGHMVGPPNNRQLIYGPCDIEVHRAMDGRVYVIDTARLFPPEPPIRAGAHLYYLLRPELVKKSKVPLSSDAFSMFGCDDAEVHESEISVAQERLFRETIPNFVMTVNQQVKKCPGLSIQQLYQKLQLIEGMHREGINVRHLHSLKKADGVVVDVRLAQLINTEIIARKIKNRLRDLMRMQLRRFISSPAKRTFKATTVGPPVDMSELAHTINTLVCVVLLQSIQTEGINLPLLLDRLQAMTGIKLTENGQRKVLQGQMLKADDFELHPRVKFSSVVPYQEGVAFYQQARLQPGEKTDVLLQAAAEKFHQALQANPCDVTVLTHYGILLFERTKLQTSVAERDHLFELAMDKFAQAVRIRRNDVYALYNWGHALQEWAQLKTGEEAERLMRKGNEKLKHANLFGKRWFFGELETNGAKSILCNKRRGTFFVRCSNSRPGHFVLSYIPKEKHKGRGRIARSVLIKETHDGTYYFEGDKPRVHYDSLEDVVLAKIAEGYEPVLKDW
eukprot:TRINITY_DN2284_c0_g3_i5.p1 TRINITY_DN2284_c0_g3~~TRINITY_DN2284_c0_g3_i5.p1  ORF type:complete len:849 (-),score=229.70 TRINITY_DN2284_c0_g3_i5:89-2314(-)